MAANNRAIKLVWDDSKAADLVASISATKKSPALQSCCFLVLISAPETVSRKTMP